MHTGSTSIFGDEETRYTLEVNEKQLRLIMRMTEEWFRLRMGQAIDFCDEIAAMNTDLSQDNPNHEWIFDKYIARRDHLHEMMRAFFRIAFEPTGYLKKKTDDMLIAEDIWDVIRCELGISRWDTALHTSDEPLPKVTRHE